MYICKYKYIRWINPGGFYPCFFLVLNDWGRNYKLSSGVWSISELLAPSSWLLAPAQSKIFIFRTNISIPRKYFATSRISWSPRKSVCCLVAMVFLIVYLVCSMLLHLHSRFFRDFKHSMMGGRRLLVLFSYIICTYTVEAPKVTNLGISFLYHSVCKVSVESGDGAAWSEVSRLIDRPGKWGLLGHIWILKYWQYRHNSDSILENQSCSGQTMLAVFGIIIVFCGRAVTAS